MSAEQSREGRSSTAAHTPGPWTLAAGDSVIEVTAYGKHIASVASVPYWKRFTETDEANARVIAAAHDMLAALQEMVRLYGNHGDDFSVDARAAARSAIAAAVGDRPDADKGAA